MVRYIREATKWDADLVIIFLLINLRNISLIGSVGGICKNAQQRTGRDQPKRYYSRISPNSDRS